MANTEDTENDKGYLRFPFMVRWFSPTLLANAAIRAAVSPVFGTFADARSVQANVDGFSDEQLDKVAGRYDQTNAGIIDENGAVWVDYLADTGDGFDSTYAMASLVAQPSVTVARDGSKDDLVLPAGRVFILGGDQVYPYPSRDEYGDRFLKPYNMAFSDLTLPRTTFVLPGNHDWYDGLNSFDFLFCQARYGKHFGNNLGSLQFQQHRSYFAVRLPHNWWILGADIQFSDYLDSGQTRYFQAVAGVMRKRAAHEPEHKVILCAAVPGWQYEDRDAHAANSNMRIIADIVEGAEAKVCVVLSGDAHHYSRYFSKKLGLNLITAGGGGAFLHPTHQLYNDIKYKWQGEQHSFNLDCRPPVSGKGADEVAVYPSKARSFWLTWGNLLFPVWNYTFATLLGTFYWLMTWMYSQTTIVARADCTIFGRFENRPLVEDILVYQTQSCGLKGATLAAQINDLATITVQAGINQFLLGICVLMLLVMLVMYADARSRIKKLLMGTMHCLVHIVAMICLYLLVNRFGVWELFGGRVESALKGLLYESSRPAISLLKPVAYMAQMIFGGGIVAGFVWGLYLFICCAFFKRHWNEAFSALRLPDYKNFLRMKLEPDRLTIYPVGLTRTPTRLEWRQGKTEKAGKLVPLVAMRPELLDGPIVIEAANVARCPAVVVPNMT